MLTRLFQLAFVTTVMSIPLAGCVVEDDDRGIDDAPVLQAPETDEPEIDIQAPGTDVEIDTVE